MHERISVNPMAMLAWPVADEAKALTRLGVHHVGVSSAKLDATGWGEGLALYRSAGIDIAYLVHPLFLPVDDPSTVAAEQERLVRTVEGAAEAGARLVYFSSGPVGSLDWDDGVAALGERLAPGVRRAGELGVELALENTSSGRSDCSFVFTVRDAANVAKTLGLAVCVDLFGCWPEPGLFSTFAENVERIRLVQVADRDRMSLIQPDRRVPGEGDLPLERLLGALIGAGYQGLFDIELLGPRIDAEGGDVAVSRAASWLDAALTRLGA